MKNKLLEEIKHEVLESVKEEYFEACSNGTILPNSAEYAAEKAQELLQELGLMEYPEHSNDIDFKHTKKAEEEYEGRTKWKIECNGSSWQAVPDGRGGAQIFPMVTLDEKDEFERLKYMLTSDGQVIGIGFETIYRKDRLFGPGKTITSAQYDELLEEIKVALLLGMSKDTLRQKKNLDMDLNTLEKIFAELDSSAADLSKRLRSILNPTTSLTENQIIVDDPLKPTMSVRLTDVKDVGENAIELTFKPVEEKEEVDMESNKITTLSGCLLDKRSYSRRRSNWPKVITSKHTSPIELLEWKLKMYRCTLNTLDKVHGDICEDLVQGEEVCPEIKKRLKIIYDQSAEVDRMAEVTSKWIEEQQRIEKGEEEYEEEWLEEEIEEAHYMRRYSLNQTTGEHMSESDASLRDRIKKGEEEDYGDVNTSKLERFDTASKGNAYTSKPNKTEPPTEHVDRMKHRHELHKMPWED